MEVIQANYNAAVKDIQEIWLETNTDNWYNHIVSLPVKQKYSYMVVILYHQVCNGGFDQYFVNTYGQFAPETIDALNEIGAKQFAKLLKAAYEWINETGDDTKAFRAGLRVGDNKLLYSDDPGLEATMNGLDDEFYATDDDTPFLDILERWLTQHSA